MLLLSFGRHGKAQCLVWPDAFSASSETGLSVMVGGRYHGMIGEKVEQNRQVNTEHDQKSSHLGVSDAIFFLPAAKPAGQ